MGAGGIWYCLVDLGSPFLERRVYYRFTFGGPLMDGERGKKTQSCRSWTPDMALEFDVRLLTAA
jgi:hypothetical protein